MILFYVTMLQAIEEIKLHFRQIDKNAMHFYQ